MKCYYGGRVWYRGTDDGDDGNVVTLDQSGLSLQDL
jgi:hypothetical protein